MWDYASRQAASFAIGVPVAGTYADCGLVWMFGATGWSSAAARSRGPAWPRS